MKRHLLHVIHATIVLLVISLTGCGQNAQEVAGEKAGSPSTASSNAPMTLTVYQTSANISDEEFQRLIVGPVQKKFPNISLQLIHQTPDATPEQIVAAGSIPDLVFGSLESIQVFSDLGVPIDLTDMVKKNRMDLGKFDPAALSAIQIRSDKGQLLALPFSVNFSVLYYNKDIFDKFAVPYPKDGMTWEQTVQLAQKVTRSLGGVQYQGIAVDGGMPRFGGQLGLQFVDPKTNKATLATDGWKRVFDVMKMINDIPGNSSNAVARTVFLKDRTVAMMPSQGARIGEIEELYSQGNEIPWGMASLPSFKEAPGKGFGPDVHLLMISGANKHKEESFAILSLLTDIEAQTEMSKGGRLSSLKDPQAKKSFGMNLKSLKGMDVGPIVNYTATPDPSYSKYSDLAKKQVGPAFNKALSGAVDINTALREAEELANQAIAAEMQGNGGK